MLNRNLIVVCLFVFIFSGIFLGFYYTSLPENNPQRSKSACESIGGKWVESKEIKCLLNYKKAGEVCDDSAQCKSGICTPPELTNEEKVTLLNNESINNITGNCYPDNIVVDCVGQIEKGVITKESMCLDNR